jgi:predicted  nucleic acid-binding Zn-ribbon protein
MLRVRQAPAETPRLDTDGFEGGKQVNPDLRNLIALQDTELKITSLQRQVSDIPKQVEAYLQELLRIEQAHQDRVAQLQEDTKRRRTFESEVDMMRARLSKLKDQLMMVKTNKEYTAMLHEIQMAEAQIRQEEDRILEIMEEMETLEAGLKKDERELKTRTEEIKKSVQACESAIPELEAALVSLRNEKARTEANIESELLARYRRIADLRKGIALAEARDELCTACHVRIRPQVYAELLVTEYIHSCDSCSRILYLREAY